VCYLSYTVLNAHFFLKLRELIFILTTLKIELSPILGKFTKIIKNILMIIIYNVED